MVWHWRNGWLLGCLLAIAGCAAQTPKLTDMEHAQHGIVPRDNPAFTADLNDCATPVYARGLTVNGRRIADRPAATAAYLGWLKETYTYTDAAEAPPPAPPPRSKQAASKQPMPRGNPSLVTGSTPAAGQAEPQFVKDYFAYEKATWDCVRGKGWTEMRG